MINVNDNFRELPSVYLFTQISRRLAKYKEENHPLNLIRMDIGDIPGPIPEIVAAAMHKAVEDLTYVDRFRGYGPEQGYSFLREVISENDYKTRGIEIEPSEIFISDGAKCDLGNLGELFSRNCRVAVMDPSYPAYTDDNVIDGRAGSLDGDRYTKIMYLKCRESDNFFPELPEERADIIYICSPNNPTGNVLPKEELQKWVDYARENKSVIIFDSAYESYIRTPGIPKTIYEIPGSREVAIEVRSFSKTGGFTGIRCGYTVVPHLLKGNYSTGEEVGLNGLWARRQTTKFNGASYISQRAAEALYSEEGKRAVRQMTDSYLQNASLLANILIKAGWKVCGGKDSPYVWAGNPYGKTSYSLFENILEECGVSSTPGSGFGKEGEGYLRFSGFNTLANTEEAVKRLSKWLEKQG